ncbi:LysR family transcriptional regulator [Lentibacillus populi]|uniref:LysR family transcriptional regulator n=1 Tax=Lentibacillus populi TaxID=1827502 RepID=A0A9W5X5A6_9BACI|nr:LysR family transcriptional regulator [Lentibacillus populi]MBT2214888.1 LysR family transcriptional regulator [Virgibacillus dakarensis]GGB42186.1 LysR family transcriptional regulator [Lentibacillus populi]
MDQHLQVFVTVAEKKNFSRAAEELHMTQPSVSQYIRTFEENIGTRLLERTNKYVRLNKAGEIVYHHAKEILGLYTNMQHLVDDLVNKAKGPLSIGASYTFGEYLLPRIIANLLETYPDIHPTVTIGNTSEIADLVATHQLDVGIVEGHFKDQQLRVEEFAEDYMVVVASPNHILAKKRGVEILDLEKVTWIVREKGSGTREATEKVFHRFKLSPAKLMNYGSTQPIKEAVEAGLGISLLSRWAIQKELRNGDLNIINIKGLPFSRKFSIVTKSPFQTKALEVFLGSLRNNKMLTTFHNGKR